MKFLLVAAAAALAIPACHATAEELRMGMAVPEQTPWGAATRKFAEDVAARTKGALTVNIYYNNELGDEQTMARQLARGRLDMAELSNVAASLLVAEYGLLQAPYVFDTPAQADCVTDSGLAAIFGDLFRASGTVYLAPVEIGHMTIMSKSAILSPDDLEDVKIRTSPTQSDTYFIRAAGGAAVPLGTVDSMPALKTGQVSAMTTPIVVGVAGGYAAAAPQITRTNHGQQIGALLISAKRWETLSAEHRQALAESARLMADLRPMLRQTENAMLDKVRAGGGTVHDLSPDELAAWQRFAPQVRDQLIAETGGTAAEKWAAIEAAKASCEAVGG
jgi:TRAP-type C4-dicarboxylate transport system substrate-binding protein